MTKIRLAISTCPNDTFTFHALMNRLVDWNGLEFDFQLMDIQQLNDGLFRNCFDVAKTSFHAALLLADDWIVLPSGSALGYGVGPLLLAANPDTHPSNAQQVALCPGEHTTATLLFRLLYPGTASVQHVVFSDIMPRLRAGDADFGVCIHEGRFTWQQQGLSLVADLGTQWEQESKCPLPLGGLVAKRTLGSDVIQRVQNTVLDSLKYAQENHGEALVSMRKYAQEFDDDVLMKHVELYVNDWTIDLGSAGADALLELSRRAKQTGLVGNSQRDIEVFGAPSHQRNFDSSPQD